MKKWSDAHQSPGLPSSRPSKNQTAKHRPEGGTAQETVDRAALDSHVHAEVGEDCNLATGDGGHGPIT